MMLGVAEFRYNAGSAWYYLSRSYCYKNVHTNTVVCNHELRRIVPPVSGEDRVEVDLTVAAALEVE